MSGISLLLLFFFKNDTMRHVAEKPQPSPAEHPVINNPENSDRIRHLHCLNYDMCLNIAVNEKWNGFTCKQCEAFEPLAGDDEKRDVDAIVSRLLVASAKANRSSPGTIPFVFFA